MLVAIAVCVLIPLVCPPANSWAYYIGLIASVSIACCGAIVSKVKQFQNSAAEEAFLITLIISGVSYLLPTILFVLPIMWITLCFKIEHVGRTIVAAILAILAITAIYAALIITAKINCPWTDFFAQEQLWSWLPISILSIGWIAVTIVRKSLRVR